MRQRPRGSGRAKPLGESEASLDSEGGWDGSVSERDRGRHRQSLSDRQTDWTQKGGWGTVSECERGIVADTGSLSDRQTDWTHKDGGTGLRVSECECVRGTEADAQSDKQT